MKRSTESNIQINHPDFLLALDGKKTCTSRYGDRSSEFAAGQVKNFCSNLTDEAVEIELTKVEVKLLKEVSSEEAWLIGQYSWADHVADFYDIYHKKLQREVNENTLVTLIHFKLK